VVFSLTRQGFKRINNLYEGVASYNTPACNNVKRFSTILFNLFI
jgi:hypothetical protein